ncbi:hypothetical protein RRG08_023680 [Elysia crispata]|uniref:Uncharacterized protein n=1 Tax=Elysia crispata TaxID=231223 RepID=A0AAE1ANI6_9GAST|nr:hypothetical protein RRG08_023680 [Elysia crispata]
MVLCRVYSPLDMMIITGHWLHRNGITKQLMTWLVMTSLSVQLLDLAMTDSNPWCPTPLNCSIYTRVGRSFGQAVAKTKHGNVPTPCQLDKKV